MDALELLWPSTCIHGNVLKLELLEWRERDKKLGALALSIYNGWEDAGVYKAVTIIMEIVKTYDQ